MSVHSSAKDLMLEMETARSIHDSIKCILDDSPLMRHTVSPISSPALFDIATKHTRSTKSVSFHDEFSLLKEGSRTDSNPTCGKGSDYMSICRIETEEWFGFMSPDLWPARYVEQTANYNPETFTQLPPAAIPAHAALESTFGNGDATIDTTEFGPSGVSPTHVATWSLFSAPECFIPVSPEPKMNLMLDCLVEAPPTVVVTTLMIRNIPNKYTRDMMIIELKNTGFMGKFDFFYLPIDFRHRCNVGYAFINLTSEASALEFACIFNGRKLKKVKSAKICVVAPAKLQGMMANAELYRYSAIRSVQEKYQPMFFKEGVEIPFPPVEYVPQTRFSYKYVARDTQPPEAPQVYFRNSIAST